MKKTVIATGSWSCSRAQAGIAGLCREWGRQCRGTGSTCVDGFWLTPCQLGLT